MRIARFDGGRVGVVVDETIYDVTDLLSYSAVTETSVVDLLPSGSRFSTEELLERPAKPVSDVRLEAPITRPSKIIGAPANYYEHIDEMPDSATIREWGVFLKASSSVIGPGDVVSLPYSDIRTDYEGELAVVIGTGGRHIPRETALEHVYGYTCLLDITIRSTEDRSTRKSFDGFTPIGPWIVTADDIPDPSDLVLRLDVDGEVRQHTATAKMIFGVEELIAYASSVMTLEPGDVIATGTPAGVGPLADGNVVTVEIDRIGALTVRVNGDGAIAHADRPGPRAGLYVG